MSRPGPGWPAPTEYIDVAVAQRTDRPASTPKCDSPDPTCPLFEVIAAAYTHNAAHHRQVHAALAKVRELCIELDLVTPRSKVLWKQLGLWPRHVDDGAPEGWRVNDEGLENLGT